METLLPHSFQGADALLATAPDFASARSLALSVADELGSAVIVMRLDDDAWGIFGTEFQRAVWSTKDLKWLAEEKDPTLRTLEYEQSEAQQRIAEEYEELNNSYARSKAHGWYHSDADPS